MTPTHATIVATVKLPEGTEGTEMVEDAVRGFIGRLGLELVPCGWAPDIDIIADATGVDYDDIVLVDLNPNRYA